MDSQVKFVNIIGAKGERGYHGLTGKPITFRGHSMDWYITCVVGAKGTKGDRGYYGFTGILINLHCHSMGTIVL